MSWTRLAELKRNLAICTTVNQGKGWDAGYTLSTLVTLVYIRVEIDVRYVTIEDRTTRVNHAIRKLGANSHSVSVCVHERRMYTARILLALFL